MIELYRKVQYFESKKIPTLLKKTYACETKKLRGTTIFSENFSGYLRFVKKGQMFIFTEGEELEEETEVGGGAA